MNHLIILAHPNPKSFSTWLTDSITEALVVKGHNVVVRDLYAIGFNPLLSRSDLASLQKGEIPADIRYEQNLLAEAEEITVIYPLWWDNAPAILRGYFERIYTNGFAFKYTDKGMVGLLSGKKVRIFTPMGNSYANYEANGGIEIMRRSFDVCNFETCGMEVLYHRYFDNVPSATTEKLQQYITEAINSYNLD